jgi:hypothetical protein
MSYHIVFLLITGIMERGNLLIITAGYSLAWQGEPGLPQDRAAQF